MRGNDELRSAACAMARRDEVDTERLPNVRGQRHAVAFTTFEPGELNDVARQIAAERELGRIDVGVCQRASRRYPSGVFWFALSY